MYYSLATGFNPGFNVFPKHLQFLEKDGITLSNAPTSARLNVLLEDKSKILYIKALPSATVLV